MFSQYKNIKLKKFTEKKRVNSIDIISSPDIYQVINIKNTPFKIVKPPIDNEYINKLCILLSSNDKLYNFKREHLNELSSVLDDKNNEFLTDLKNPFINNNFFNKRSNSSKSMIMQKEINYNFDDEDLRTPELIRHNEKFLFDFFKNKNKVHIPYLSRRNNDLIINKKNSLSVSNNEDNKIQKSRNNLKMMKILKIKNLIKKKHYMTKLNSMDCIKLRKCFLPIIKNNKFIYNYDKGSTVDENRERDKKIKIKKISIT